MSPPRNDGKALLALSPTWSKRLAAVQSVTHGNGGAVQVIPVNPDYFSKDLHFVDDENTAVEMLDLARQRPLSFIGFDTEFKFSRPGVLVKHYNGRDLHWHDPRSVVPLLLALAMFEPTDVNQMSVYRFVVDLRRHQVRPSLELLFRLPLRFVAHYITAELFCLWQCGLSTPAIAWDTWTAERTFCLGRYHAKYGREQPTDDCDEAQAKELAERKLESSLALETTCVRRGIAYPFTRQKERLRKSFLQHPADRPFDREQLDYASADAVAAATLYPVQLQHASNIGCLRHLETVEMDWTVTNARTSWDGIRVDKVGVQKLRAACVRNIGPLESELAGLGLTNVNSHKQMMDFFQREGLLDCFRKGGKFSFDDKHLEGALDRHPAISKIRELRKIRRLLKDKLLSGELIGVDDRLHPDHRQFGAETGRNSMRWPNIGGVGRALRPLVVPAPGCAIGEVDLSQIEVGIAAAVYGDPELTRMYNSQDVYTAMAKQYFANDLTPEDLRLADKIFKKRHRLLREKMKTFTLAIIYGVTSHGLAIQLGLSQIQAENERLKFLDMFPVLCRALREASAYGGIRGCAYLCTGLRRQRAKVGRTGPWESNWLTNTPVQGSAAIVFKVAGNRLRRRYEHYGAKLILPLHDAFVFECPKHTLRSVAKITAEVMCSTVQEFFPVLQPRAEINIDHPECWNKDGKHRSLRLWMVNPELAFT